jgi:hypothetical protein
MIRTSKESRDRAARARVAAPAYSAICGSIASAGGAARAHQAPSGERPRRYLLAGAMTKQIDEKP